MRLLDKYITNQYIKSFFIVMLSFMVVFLVVDFFDNFPKLLRQGASFHNTLLYFTLRLPYLFVLTSPIAVLLSGLFLMDTLSKYNESVAIRAAGISIVRMVSPLLIFGFIFSIFMFAFSDYVLPRAEKYRLYLYHVKIKGQTYDDIKMKSNSFYRGENNTLFYIGFFDGYRNILKNVDITFLDENDKIIKKVQSPFVEWDEHNNKWVLKDYFIRTFNDGNLISLNHGDSLLTDYIKETPKDFIKKKKNEFSMTLFELKDYIARLKSIGEPTLEEEVDMHVKLSFPFVNFIILFFSVPLASTSNRSKSRGLIFLMGLLITFLYLSAVQIGQSLGYNGIIKPVYAAWSANIIFGIIGLFTLIKAEV